MILHGSKCPNCGAGYSDSGQPSNRVFFTCESYGYMGKPGLTHMTAECEARSQLREAWQIIQVLHAARLDDREPWLRALEWLARNEHLRTS
jgi:hypothetical protein